MELGLLLDAGEGAVVTLEAGGTRLAAHRAVLAAGSPVWAAMFRHQTLEASSGRVTVPDVEGAVLRQLVAFLYTAQPPPLPPPAAAQLLAAADKYGVAALKAHCERQVAAQLTVETAAAAAVVAVRHSCAGLRQAALGFIRARPAEVMATQGWLHAQRTQPQDLAEVSRLLCDHTRVRESGAAVAGGCGGGGREPCRAVRGAWQAALLRHPVQYPGRSQSLAAAAPPATGCSSRSAAPDEVTVCRMRTLSEERRDRRLIEVAHEGSVEELRALLAAGADVAARDEDFERTALHWAARAGRLDAAASLLRAGADVDARDGWRNTPLHWAAYRGHAPLVRLLLAHSPDPDARDEDGRTPLHDAAEEGHAEVVAALLAAGADRRCRNRYGETPRDLARQSNRHQLLEMLP